MIFRRNTSRNKEITIRRPKVSTRTVAIDLPDEIASAMSPESLAKLREEIRRYALELSESAKESADRFNRETLPALTQRAEQVAEALRTTGRTSLQKGAALAQTASEEIIPSVKKGVEKNIPAVTASIKQKASQSAQSTEEIAEEIASRVKPYTSQAKYGAARAVESTKSFTKDSIRLIFWLTVAAWLLLMIFVPDKDKRKELYNRILRFL